MNEKELLEKARRLLRLQKTLKRMKAEEEELKEAFKTYMGQEEELKVGGFHIRWKTVTSAQLDTAALKKALPEVAAAFTRESVCRRFSIE